MKDYKSMIFASGKYIPIAKICALNNFRAPFSEPGFSIEGFGFEWCDLNFKTEEEAEAARTEILEKIEAFYMGEKWQLPEQKFSPGESLKPEDWRKDDPHFAITTTERKENDK